MAMAEKGQNLGRHNRADSGRLSREGRYATHGGSIEDSILGLIVSKQIPIETPFSETKASEMLGFSSRTPIVREALQRLEGEGVLDIRPQRGCWVKRVPQEEADLIFGLRAMNEWFILGPLGRQHDIRQLRPLDYTLMDMKIAADEANVEEFTLLDAEFHKTLPNVIGVPSAASAIRGWTDNLVVYRAENPFTSDEMKNITWLHSNLMEQLVSGDRTSAALVINLGIESHPLIQALKG